MNFIRNRNFRAGPQTSLEGFICPQNSDKQQKIKVFGRSGGWFIADFYLPDNIESIQSHALWVANKELKLSKNIKYIADDSAVSVPSVAV